MHEIFAPGATVWRKLGVAEVIKAWENLAL